MSPSRPSGPAIHPTFRRFWCRRLARPRVPTFPLCTHLVRVLDDGGKAVGPWDPKLAPDTLRKMLKDMKTVRVFDDRMYRAQRQGKTSFYMKCTGEEAIAVATATATVSY